jgi:uncharacterized protein (TIGR03067 family)
MTRPVLVLLVVCSLSFVPAIADDKPTGDARLVQGSWDWDPAVKQSDAKPQVLLEGVVVKGDTLTFHYLSAGERSTCAVTFKLNPDASPKEIDFTPTEGANKDKTYLGLYELKAGQLRICYRGPGSTRPKNFDDKSAGNDATVFIVLKPTPKL